MTKAKAKKAEVKEDKPKKFGTIPKAKLLYGWGLFKAEVQDKSEPEDEKKNPKKFSCVLLVEKSDDESTLGSAGKLVRATAKEELPDIYNKKGFKWPWNCGDRKDEEYEGYEHYKGHWYINLSSREKFPPKVYLLVDAKAKKVKPLTSFEEVGNGAIVEAILGCYSFNIPENKGMGFGLKNLIVLEEGVPSADGTVSVEDSGYSIEPEGEDLDSVKGDGDSEEFSSDGDSMGL